MDEQLSMFAYLVGCAALKYALGHWWKDRFPPDAVRVGTVSRITLFPVKSVGGAKLPRAECTVNGLKLGDIRDRTWLVTYGEENRLVTARQEPKLTTITSRIEDNKLYIDFKGQQSLRLPAKMEISKSTTIVPVKIHGMNMKGLDCGDEAAEWISKVLGNKPGHRLLHHVPELPLRATSDAVWAYKRDYFGGARPEDEVAYQDSGPFTLGTDASLANLNSKMTEPMPAEQFRHTFEVTSMCPAFDEDTWYDVYIGQAWFISLGPIERCLLTTASPITGQLSSNREPLATLKRYRCVFPELFSGPAFGRILLLTRPGSVQVGDPVFAVKKE